MVEIAASFVGAFVVPSVEVVAGSSDWMAFGAGPSGSVAAFAA